MARWVTLLLLLGGPGCLLITRLFLPPASISPAQWTLIGILAWMILWWGSEVVPIAVTSLLPLLLFPFLHVLPEATVAAYYAHPLTFLFMGGFFIAIALEKANLHHRLALGILRYGSSPMSTLAGMMAATALLSMWISNTATALMMVPIGMALIRQLSDSHLPASQVDHFAKPMMLSIAYCASIGGLGTLIGTPTNIYFARFFEHTYGIRISMLDWMKIGLPFMALMLAMTFGYLVLHFRLWRVTFGDEIRAALHSKHTQLPQMTRAQWAVLFIFLATCVGWVMSSPLQKWTGLPLSDTAIALLGATALMVVPTSLSPKRFLLSWDDAVRIPWGVLLLFGAGLAITAGFESTGLHTLMGQWFTRLSGINEWVLLIAFLSVGLMVTELLSNSAAIAAMLPVAAAIAAGTGLPPILLMLPVTLATSGGFMMPAGTPPNAIVLGTGALRVSDMLQVGFVLNLIMLAVIVFIAAVAF